MEGPEPSSSEQVGYVHSSKYCISREVFQWRTKRIVAADRNGPSFDVFREDVDFDGIGESGGMKRQSMLTVGQ